VLVFSLSEHHDADNAHGTPAMVTAVHGGHVPGVVMHTDQGGEFTATAFRDACARMGICQSMGRPGSALDNAVIEFWHSTLESELRSLQHFATRAGARAAVAAWIEDYNHHRRHSACHKMPRVAYEQMLAAHAKEAASVGPASPPPIIGRCSAPSRSYLLGRA
jgi:putative transposase